MTEEENAVSISFLSHSMLDQSKEESKEVLVVRKDEFGGFKSSLEEIHMHSPSVVINDEHQTYTGLLCGNQYPRCSTVYTNMSSESSRARGNPLANKEVKDTNSSQSISQITRLYCRYCIRVVPAILNVRPKHLNLWKTIFNFFTSNQCCKENAHNSEDLVYTCTSCGRVVARVNHK